MPFPYTYFPFEIESQPVGPASYQVPPQVYAMTGAAALIAIARATYYAPAQLELAAAELGKILRHELPGPDQIAALQAIADGAKLASDLWGLPPVIDPADPLLYPSNFPPAVLLGEAPLKYNVAPETLAEAGMLALELASRARYFDPELLEQVGELFGRIYVGSATPDEQADILTAARAYADRMRKLYKLPPFDVTKPQTFAHTSGCGGGCGTGGTMGAARTGRARTGACCGGCAGGGPCDCDGARTGLDPCADQHVIDPEADWPRPGPPTDNPCGLYGCRSGVLAGCHDDRCPVPFSTLFGPTGNADFGRCG